MLLHGTQIVFVYIWNEIEGTKENRTKLSLSKEIGKYDSTEKSMYFWLLVDNRLSTFASNNKANYTPQILLLIQRQLQYVRIFQMESNK